MTPQKVTTKYLETYLSKHLNWYIKTIQKPSLFLPGVTMTSNIITRPLQLTTKSSTPTPMISGLDPKEVQLPLQQKFRILNLLSFKEATTELTTAKT